MGYITIKRKWLLLWLLAMLWQVNGGEIIISDAPAEQTNLTQTLKDSIKGDTMSRNATVALPNPIVSHGAYSDNQFLWLKTAGGKNNTFVTYNNVQKKTNNAGLYKLDITGMAKRFIAREEKKQGTPGGKGSNIKIVFDEEHYEWESKDNKYAVVELKFIPPEQKYLLVVADEKSKGIDNGLGIKCKECEEYNSDDKNDESKKIAKTTHYYQSANNEVAIYYKLLGLDVDDIESVILTVDDKYTLYLPKITGEKLMAVIKTKGGKLIGNDENGKEVLYSATEYRKDQNKADNANKKDEDNNCTVKISVKTKKEPFTIESKNLEITPLIADVSTIPNDISNGVCPYTDKVKKFTPPIEYELWTALTKTDFVPSSPMPITTIEKNKRSYTVAYGLGIECEFLQDLSKTTDGGAAESSITFTASGGDLNGERKYEITDFVNFAKAGTDKILEWEGFINNANADKINEVRDLGRESTICPLDVVKEDDNYKIKITVEHPEYPEQKQTFEIHNLKVIYRTDLFIEKEKK